MSRNRNIGSALFSFHLSFDNAAASVAFAYIATSLFLSDNSDSSLILRNRIAIGVISSVLSVATAGFSIGFFAKGANEMRTACKKPVENEKSYRMISA
jgi:hypothetical protein